MKFDIPVKTTLISKDKKLVLKKGVHETTDKKEISLLKKRGFKVAKEKQEVNSESK
jgi:hypothetical protein